MAIGHLVRASLRDAPAPCRACTWWQAGADKERWAQGVEGRFGAWGMLYRDDDTGRTLGLVQYGPVGAFRHARRLPAGPPSSDAVLVTCALLEPEAGPWVLQRLLLAVAGETRDRGLIALEAFATHVERPGAPHLVPLPRAALEDIGFAPLREDGEVALLRLDLRGLVTVPVAADGVVARGREPVRARRRSRVPAR
ncbi:MAG: hypothetical protein ACKOSO_09045 [Actinomycetota bacterium]